MARDVDRGSRTLSALIVEFCIVGIARTARSYRQGRPLRAWQENVRDRAIEAMEDLALVEGFVDLRITEFGETRIKDRDNLAKPIQDAMQGVVYRNDRQVLRLDCDWRDINGLFRVRLMSRPVAAALVAGREFVWIRVYHHRPSEDLTA